MAAQREDGGGGCGGGEEDFEVHDWDEALERLHPLRRGIEEVLEEAEARDRGDDAVLEVLLRHRTSNCEAAETIGRQCAEEEVRVRELRSAAGEVQNAMAKDRLRRARTRDPPAGPSPRC